MNRHESQPYATQGAEIISLAGSYMLLITLENDLSIVVGRLGLHAFKAGSYAYTGSAHGSGGLRGRIERHLRQSEQKKLHWHIDALTVHANIMEIWWTTAPGRFECHWAEALAQIGSIDQPRFGASDCRCPGHLIYLGDAPCLQEIWDAIEATTPSKLHCWKKPNLTINLEEDNGT